MTIRLRFAWGEGADPLLMRMAGWSAGGHVVAIIVFSILPRLAPPIQPPRATIAEIVPASALWPGAARDTDRRSPSAETLTPTQRARAAKEATRRTPPPSPAPERAPVRPPARKPIPPPPDEPAVAQKPHAETPPAEPDNAHSPAAEEEASQGSSGETEQPAAGGPGISFGGPAGMAGIPSIGSSAFPYDYYRASLVAILQSNWRRPVAPEGLGETLTCRVQFTILKSGIIQDPKIAQPSGNDGLDQSALRAIYNSNPLPPLPVQYGRASVAAEVLFELTPD